MNPTTSDIGNNADYEQVGDLIYFFQGTSVYTYDVNIEQITSNSIPGASGIQGWSCWTHDTKYIYFVGGYYSPELSMYNFSSGSFITGAPQCNAGRYVCGCEVSPNGKLYAIAGWGPHDSAEMIHTTNIMSNSWTYLSDTLIETPSSYTATVLYGDYIFVMGGRSFATGQSTATSMYIINTITDSITLSDERLVYGTLSGSAVILKGLNVGGCDGSPVGYEVGLDVKSI